jgi:hypothetical protein
MTAREVLDNIATMPSEEWLKIQAGIAEMLAARFPPGETSAIANALAEAQEEFSRGEGIAAGQMRRHFGLE